VGSDVTNEGAARPSNSPRRLAVVTGGDSGLGFAIAMALASRGLDLVLVARNAGRLSAAAEAIRGAVPGATVEELLTTDLASPAEVQRVAETIAREHPRVDLLVNNAGGIFARRDVSPEGVERTFALNVLAPFALTYRLAGPLLAAPHARVVNVASAAHRGHRLPMDDLLGERRYSGWRAYGRSKLALILLSREFARRWAGSSVMVFAVHPGFVRTRFGLNNPGALGLGFRVALALFAIGPRRGAETPVFVATDPSLEGYTGLYFARRRVRLGSGRSRDGELGQRLFERCRELTGLASVSLPGSGVARQPPSA
jgi:NAD(P)-dependent dehydrogenase (short-subunit alcohol dehydrogenase family)